MRTTIYTQLYAWRYALKLKFRGIEFRCAGRRFLMLSASLDDERGRPYRSGRSGVMLLDSRLLIYKYTGAPIVGIARWSVPRIGQGHLEVKW